MFFSTGASTSLQARRLPISFTLFWYTFRSFYFCFCVTVIHFYPVVFLFFPPICAVSSATGSDFLHLRLLRIRSGTIAHELLQKEIEQVRNSEQTLAILRHDMRHHLNLILSMLNQNHPEKAISYIQEIGTAYDDTIVTRYCKNETLNSVISIYKTRFLERNINFLPEICVQKDLPCPDLSLCTILSNALENALHALEHTSGEKSFAVGNKKSY